MNPVAHEKPEDPPVIQGKESKGNSSKKSKSSKHAKNKHQSSEKEHNISNDSAYSKYNVVSKCVKQKRLLVKQVNEDKYISDSSDSEESIFEVPVPPKPKPPLIDLQDSDEESDTNTGIDKDDPILKKWDYNPSMKTYSKIRNHELQLRETSNNHQDTSSKSNIDKPLYNEDSINLDKNIQTLTCAQEIMEDIVLNCTIQRGAKNINEIKELSKNVEIESKSTENTNQNFKGGSSQNKSKGNNENNANLQQETFLISRRKSQVNTQQNVDKSNINNIYNRYVDQDKTSRMESCNSIDRKRQCNSEVDSHSKQKRQCTNQQSNQDVIPQGNSNKEKRNLLRIDFHKPMLEQMRDYNLSHGQENFDVSELQRGMSKDPRMWAILDEDLMPCPSSKQRTRFWNVRCTKCQRDGHQRYDCTEPRKAKCCTMCGMKGHIDVRCPRKMCLTCGKQQKTFRPTCEFCFVLYCTMCNSVGHELKNCPDLWRRYHQTIDMSNAPQDPGNVMKPSRLLQCCNCTKRGHESSTCKEFQWSPHFVTPAVVTNYTDGPTYVLNTSSSSKRDLETGILSTEATGNKTLIPQSASNIQQTMTEDVESFANVDTLSSNANFSISSTLQEVACISEMEGNLKSSPMANKIWSTEKMNRQTVVNEITFINVIYSFGTFCDKNHKDARMILKNLSTFFPKKSMLDSLINQKVAPVFLKTLHDKEIGFEVKMGFSNHQTVMLQLLAMKDYIEYLYDLLRYWLNLLDDEKYYGIDVTLPLNPIKMFNLLKSRVPQLEKMRFTCYANHIGGENDPRWIYNFITNSKIKLKRHKGSKKEYNRLRTKLWRLQVKLLMIVNTEPEPNDYVHMFRDVMNRFESKQYLMYNRLDIATYLKIILLYNNLFVPHTSDNVHKTLNHIVIEERNQNKNNSLQMQQKSKVAVCEQEDLYNVCSSSSSAASCIPQNINRENSSTINNQHNNEMLLEGQNVNNTLFEISERIGHNYDEIITIQNSYTQDSQFMPLNIEPMAQSQDLERNEGQLSTNEVNIGSNVFANKQDISIILDQHNTPFLSKKEKNRRQKKLKKSSYINFLAEIKGKRHNAESIYKKALDLIKKARTFKLPHMRNAADEMQRQINNQTVKVKHVRTLSKLILLEQRYQRDIDNYCRKLQK